MTATSAAFRIEQAARVRWEWFYYDRPQTPENLQRIEYVRSPDGRITVTDTFAEGTVRNHVHSPDEAAVEMLSTFAE